MRFAPLIVAFALVAPACGAPTTSSPRDFEQASLNRAWYGTYHRPLPDDLRGAFDRDPQARAAREDERDARRAERAAEREEAAARDEAVAARQPEPAPAREAASPTPGSRASLGPASSPRAEAPSIPTASRGGFDPAAAAAYVRDVYAVNETELGPDDAIASMYRYATENGRVYHHTRPVVGDLVFFNNTHDADGDGRPNDFFSHVGIVERVDEDATVTVLSYLDGRVRRFVMNLEAPSVASDGGRELNTAIRERSRDDLPSTAYLSGELFVGFASLLGSRNEVIVLDNWSPATRLDGLRAER